MSESDFIKQIERVTQKIQEMSKEQSSPAYDTVKKQEKLKKQEKQEKFKKQLEKIVVIV